MVNERTHEIGIRMALGAGPSKVLRLVLGQGLKLTLAGVTLGLMASLAVTRVIGGFLYGVKPTDPMTFAAVSLLFTAVALLGIAGVSAKSCLRAGFGMQILGYCNILFSFCNDSFAGP